MRKDKEEKGSDAVRFQVGQVSCFLLLHLLLLYCCCCGGLKDWGKMQPALSVSSFASSLSLSSQLLFDSRYFLFCWCFCSTLTGTFFCCCFGVRSINFFPTSMCCSFLSSQGKTQTQTQRGFSFALRTCSCGHASTTCYMHGQFFSLSDNV